MDGQPITLKGRNKRGDFRIDARDNESESDGKKGKRGNEDSDHLLLVLKFENQVDQNNSPREENQGFVHIG